MPDVVDIQSAADEAAVSAEFAADELESASDSGDAEAALEHVQAARRNLEKALDAISGLH